MRKSSKVCSLMIISILCLMLSWTTMAAGINLLPNPNVETPDPNSSGMPKDWTYWKSAGAQYVVDFEWSNDVARSGKHSLKIGSVSTGSSALWQSTIIPGIKGNKYRASVYVKAEGARKGEEVTLSIRWMNSASGFLTESARETINIESNMDWTLITVEGVAPEGCAKIRVQVSRKANIGGNVWFDDFELVNVGRAY